MREAGQRILTDATGAGFVRVFGCAGVPVVLSEAVLVLVIALDAISLTRPSDDQTMLTGERLTQPRAIWPSIPAPLCAASAPSGHPSPRT